MKKFYFIITCILYTLNLTAQTTYERLIGDELTDRNFQFGNNTRTADGGSLIVASEKNQRNHQDFYKGILIAKLNEKGETEWIKRYGDTISFDVRDVFAVQTSSGNYVIVSNSYTNKNSLLIIGLSVAGKLLWSKMLSPKNIYSYIKCGNLGLASDDNLLLTGSTSIFDNYGDAFILKLNSENGNPVWMKTSGKPDVAEQGNAIARTQDSGFIMCGNLNFTDFYVAKYNKNGDREWAKRFASRDKYNSSDIDDIALGITQTNDGGYVFTGKKQEIANELNENFCMVKLDKDGNKKWAKQLGSHGAYDAGNAVVENKDSSLILLGSVTYPVQRARVIKLNKNGSLVWSKYYGYNDGLSMSMRNIFKDKKTGYIISGPSTFSDVRPGYGKGVFVAKIDNSGRACSDIELQDSTIDFTLNSFSEDVNLVNDAIDSIQLTDFPLTKSKSTGYNVFTCTETLQPAAKTNNIYVDDTRTKFNVTVTPNPVKSLLHLNITTDAEQSIQVSIVNIQGKLLQTTQLKNTGKSVNTVFNVSNLSNGVYFF